MKSSRSILIAGNWKMNYGPRETENYFSQLQALLSSQLKSGDLVKVEKGQVEVLLIPPFISLSTAFHSVQNFSIPINLAAQNAHPAQKGAFTGEVSGAMIKELQIQTVLIGHSERRHLFHESDELISQRVSGLLEQGFKVILCVGETRNERENGQTEKVLERQLSSALGAKYAPYLKGQLIIAYEPVWAIGTGLTATPEQAENAHHYIRNYLKAHFDALASENTSILYGGSVTPENVSQLLSQENVDGALVGGASLKPESFLALIQAGIKQIES